MPRAVIHIDLDAFFSSVELKRRPELKGKPVVVGADGDPAKRGVVSAASYEARSRGVSAGMPLKKAQKLCPEAVFLPVDFQSYEKESEAFMAVLRDYSPLVESFGLDEAFLEMPLTSEDPFELATRTGREIKDRIKKELRLAVTVGIGPNKLLAKMASDAGKPDGFFILMDKDVDPFLRDLPVRRLWGVGAKTEKRLKDLGIRTLGELAKAPVQHLEMNFGPNIGRTLHEHARGIDENPVVPFYEPRSMGREVTFEEDTKDIYLIKETVYALTEDVTARLKQGDYKCGMVSIKIRFSDFKTITHAFTFEAPADSLNDIWAGVLRLIEQTDFPKAVRLVGVRLSDLEGKG